MNWRKDRDAQFAVIQLETARRERDHNLHLYQAMVADRDDWKERFHAAQTRVNDLEAALHDLGELKL